MQKLTNEEVAKVFSMYKGAKVESVFGSTKEVVNLLGVVCNTLIYEYDGDGGLTHYCDLDECNEEIGVDKLMLTHISKIIDEDAIEVGKMTGIWSEEELASYDNDFGEIAKELKMFGKSFVKVLSNKNDLGMGFLDALGGAAKGLFYAYQYLKSKSYAVPLFFAPNHPCNGKTAIELGLAIEKL